MKPDDPAPAHDDTRVVTEADDPLDTTSVGERLWLRTILKVLQGSCQEPHPNPRVQFALDRVQIAACERAIRILGSDLSRPSA